MVIATEADKKLFDTEIIPKESQIGISWQAHMKCHQDFDFIRALKEKYLFIK